MFRRNTSTVIANLTQLGSTDLTNENFGSQLTALSSVI